uniref:glycosyltransferase family 2 protein n=1 Tax=Pedobacter schmidteae TaxID=2201271 RepID=UPI000EAE8EFF|nr:hypothetical protein [Pedobacter schmidteae]
MIEFVYAVLVFLVLRFCVTLFNFLSNPKLGYYGKHFAAKVSVIIMAPNTPADLKKLLASIDTQEYSHLEIIVQRHESVTELMKKATGEYFLFLSSATTLHHGLINNLIYRTKVFNLAVLSLVPTYRLTGFLSKCVYPLSDFLLLNLLPLRLIRLSSLPAFAAGSNDCLFFDAAMARQFNWLKNIGTKLPAATEVVKMVKQQQSNAEVLIGNKMICIDVELKNLDSFSERLMMNFSNSGLVALIYLVLVLIGPVVVLFSFNPALLILPVGLIFLSRMMIAFLTAQNPIMSALLHPLQMLCMFVLLLRTVGRRILRSFKLKK